MVLVIKNPPANTKDEKDAAQSLGGEDPLEEGMATPSRFLHGKSHGPRSLVGYSL